MAQTPRNQYVVIVAGGTGTRLWPLSRKAVPKQFLSLVGTGNFLQQSYKRACLITTPDKVFIVAPDHFAGHLPKYIPNFPEDHFIGEPMQAGTTAAFGFAATYIHLLDPLAILHFIASDDYIKDDQKHASTLKQAAQIVDQDNGIVIYGVNPSYPNTGYGYVKVVKSSRLDFETTSSYKVNSFHEKPDLETAQKYLATGEYFWHCFGFTIKAEVLLELIKTHHLETYTILLDIKADLSLPSRLEKTRLLEHYQKIQRTDYEFTILEKAWDKLTVVMLEDTWNDIGSWLSVFKVRDKDQDGNVIVGDKQRVIQVDSKGNLIATNSHPIVLAGVENMAVIDTGDIILITPLEKSQKVKEIVAKLKDLNLEKYL